MSLKVIARRGDTLMLAGDLGPGVVLVRPGMEPAVVHRDAAFARGYWRAADAPTPEISDDVVSALAAFNAQWGQTQLVLRGEETSRSTEPDDQEILRASSALDGDELEAYWTRGKGLARWSTHPHPWRRLRGLLRKHPRIRDPEGLASHYFHVVFKIWPGERKGSNPAGPG